MALSSFLAALPPDLRLTVADVGSAGGLQKRWNPARQLVEGMLFEPRDGGSVRRAGPDTIYPVALGAAPGTVALNITALANMSSTLTPNADLLSTFRKKGEDVAIVDRQEMKVDTLDRICAEDGRKVDAIKVDVQGSELIILAGAEKTLTDDVLLAEVEVSFLRRYHDQALAEDVLPYMAARGFDLIELHRPKRYRAKNNSNVVSPHLLSSLRSGRVAYADGIFFIREDRLIERLAGLPREEAEATALKAMLALLVYAKPDIAARLFDLSADYLAPERRKALGQWFKALGRGSMIQRMAGKLIGRRG